MRQSRIFIEHPMQAGHLVELDKDSMHYLLHVLRLKTGDMLIVFNGQGGEYEAELSQVSKKSAVITIGKHYARECETTVHLHLLQSVSRPEHMDIAIQKAVELGVSSITPIITTRSPSLPAHHFAKRQRHWSKIIQHACEQSGRNRLPFLSEIQALQDALSESEEQDALTTRLILTPSGTKRFQDFAHTTQAVFVLVGPEGGFSEVEYTIATQKGYTGVTLGPRVLRTETAAIAALTACQMIWGDF